jgi:uncharacterized protein
VARAGPGGECRAVSATVDTNVLLYAWNRDDPAHEPAREILERLLSGNELLYLFWPVLMGYLRIATHPAIFANPAPPPQIMSNITTMLGLSHVRAPGEAPGFWSEYREVGENLRGNAVPDAHLVALMHQHEVRVIYTRDRGFRRFDSIEQRDLLGG